MDRSAIRRFADSVNREERRKAERYMRTSPYLRPGTVFVTGLGKKNRIMARNKIAIFIKADEGKATVKVPASSITKMLAYFLRARIVERRELEVFNGYSSAMFGLLAAVFQSLVKIDRNGNLLRLILKGVRMFLAGFERSPRDLSFAVDSGARHVLGSFFYLRNGKAWKERLRRYGLHLILDCGQFSVWSAQTKGKQTKLSLWEYCEFIRNNEEFIDHYFAFDVIGDWRKTMEALNTMESLGLNPIPIFHMGSPFYVLEELVNRGYPVIALGGTVNKKPGEVEDFFDKVFSAFPSQAFHGLGVSRAAFLAKYPFFSCDSKAWLLVRWKDILLRAERQVRAAYLPLRERMAESIRFWLSLDNPVFAEGR